MAEQTPNDLYTTLSELGLIDQAALEKAQTTSTEQQIPLDVVLNQERLITSAALGKVISDAISIPYVDLPNTTINKEVLQLIPKQMARTQRMIAYQQEADTVHVAIADRTNTQATTFIERKTGTPVTLHLAALQDITDALALYSDDITDTFKELIQEGVEEAEASGAEKAEPSIINIVDTIMTYAHESNSSDIHIEPGDERTLVRFRIDGVLHDVVSIPNNVHRQVVTRIKVLAKLRTDEHQAALDGKFQTKANEEELDVRVSIIPTTKGESIVMRLLSERARQYSLDDLGLTGTARTLVEKAYKKPHGMILATGPTGSGKTTTLYAIVKQLNKREVNIMTIEDPVEYEIQGINQIQVNTKTNLTFAAGLRSIVRQDPDIILVGEIRDEETADIAVNSSMTGHLVLSTLHTNDAATTLPRLLEMEVEPFLVASTVNVIIAQRLVRKVCQNCRVSTEIALHAKEGSGKDASTTTAASVALLAQHFPDKETLRTYQGKGCPVCHQTGYVGRIGVFEVLEVNDAIREAIVARKDADTIRTLAIEAGMTTMLQDGITKVEQGLTTIDEVIRVTTE